MQRRTWDAQTKVLIILKGFKGKTVAAMCPAHQMNQSLYAEGRDQFLVHAASAFDDLQRPQKEALLTHHRALQVIPRDAALLPKSCATPLT